MKGNRSKVVTRSSAYLTVSVQRVRTTNS